MIITNASITDLEKAIEKINKKYDNNIEFNPFLDYSDSIIKRYKGSLSIKDFNKAGARIGLIDKSNKLACWHAHHDFFNILLEINLNTIICVYGDWIIKKISGNKIMGNLNKINKNSAYYTHKFNPLSFLCRCKQNT